MLSVLRRIAEFETAQDEPAIWNLASEGAPRFRVVRVQRRPDGIIVGAVWAEGDESRISAVKCALRVALALRGIRIRYVREAVESSPQAA